MSACEIHIPKIVGCSENTKPSAKSVVLGNFKILFKEEAEDRKGECGSDVPVAEIRKCGKRKKAAAHFVRQPLKFS